MQPQPLFHPNANAYAYSQPNSYADSMFMFADAYKYPSRYGDSKPCAESETYT